MTLIRVSAERGHLARAPLALVAAQINFDPILRLSDGIFIAPLQDRLRDRYPVVSRVAGLQVMIGDEGLRAEPGESAAWAFASSDQRWQVTVSQNVLALQSTQHDTFEELRDRFVSVLGDFIDLFTPGARRRLGLRYINRLMFEDAATVSEWRQLVQPALLGLGGAEGLVDPSFVLHSFGQARLASEESQMIVRYGLLESGTISHPSVEAADRPHFLLDMDHFDLRLFERIEVGEVEQHLTTFHDDIYRLFRWSLTPDGLARLESGDEGGDSDEGSES